jgi:hypothetical protein
VTRKLNCWEFKNCGREKGGLMVSVLGECPVAGAMDHDGQNDGIAAGRVCWTIKCTGNRLAGAGLGPGHNCHACEFYRRVIHEQEEKAQFRFASPVT